MLAAEAERDATERERAATAACTKQEPEELRIPGERHEAGCGSGKAVPTAAVAVWQALAACCYVYITQYVNQMSNVFTSKEHAARRGLFVFVRYTKRDALLMCSVVINPRLCNCMTLTRMTLMNDADE
jgi:hypothetical protein